MREPAVPLVLFGRYSTLHGGGTFVTLPVDATPFESVTVEVWRGAMAAGHSFQFVLQTSTDGQVWYDGASGDPGANQEAGYTETLGRSWLRAKVTTSGISGELPTVTLYAVGTLYRRRP